MGYISLAKATGDIDLLPAENIVHVSMTDNSTAVIKYGISDGYDDKILQATVVFATAWAVEGSKAAAVVARIAINNAISAAGGTAGPAIPVQLQAGQYVSSVTITFA